MAFFGLTDIKFNDIERRVDGPLSALDSNPYLKSSVLRYPIDVGSVDKGHYMMFFVREQTITGFSSESRGGQQFTKEQESELFNGFKSQLNSEGRVSSSAQSGLSGILNNALGGALSKGANFLSGKGETGAKIGSAINSFVSGPKKATKEEAFSPSVERSVAEITDKSPFGFLNRTKLTNDAIALYMPDTINFDSTASYSDVRPGEETTGQFLAAAPELYEAYKSGGGGSGGTIAAAKVALKSGLGRNLLEGFATKLLGQNTGRLGVYAGTGRVNNPMIELIYGSPELRSFQFEFIFYPRSEQEAYDVQRIIDRFRFHQAPELDLYESGRQTGMLIPPSEFDIKFYYAGKQNPNIPRIGSCVLQNVQVNFAPRGWSAYEVPGENSPSLGRTGMPTAIQMSLQFKETTYITKQDFSSQGIDAAQGQSGQYAGVTEGVAFGKMR
jgi:hypothetical protein